MHQAANCLPVLHARHGWSWTSERPDEVVVNEPRNRMAIKSQNYVIADLAPAHGSFYFHRACDLDEACWGASQKCDMTDHICMLMGL